MTRGEILALESGAVLDELVATKVMGWRWDTDWNCNIPPEQTAKPWYMWTDWQLDESGELFRKPIRENYVDGIAYSGDSSRIIMPNWSRDWGAAGRVLEKMKLAVGPSTVEGLWYSTLLGSKKEGAEAQTPQVAICRAALLAMLD